MLYQSCIPIECAVCGRKFLPQAAHQKFCGVTCRRKNERAQARARDPVRLERARVPWSGELFNPTAGQLDQAVLTLRGLVQMHPPGTIIPPIKIVGIMPASWVAPPDISVQHGQGNPPHRVMSYDEFGGKSFDEIVRDSHGAATVVAPSGVLAHPDVPDGFTPNEWAQLSPEDKALIQRGTPDPRAMRGADVPPERPKLDSLENL